jgi:hypothetical protein
MVAVAVEQPRVPVHVPILVWQGAALAVFAPELQREFPSDAHGGFVSWEKLGNSVYFVAFSAQIAIEVETSGVPLQQCNQRVGRDGNRILPVAAQQKRLDNPLALLVELLDLGVGSFGKAACGQGSFS